MIAGGRRYIVYGSRSDEITLWSLADIHYGNRGVAKDRLKTDLEDIETNPRAFWMGVGDYADYIGYRDSRFDPEVIDESIAVKDLGSLGRRLTGDVREMFRPIERKCIGLMEGNHERSYEVYTEQQQLAQWLATELDTLWLGYCCFVDLIFVRHSGQKVKLLPMGAQPPPPHGHERWGVRIFAHHGAGFAQTPGGKLNTLIRFMDYFQADLTIVAHIHDQTAKRQSRLRADRHCRKIVEIPQLGIITGSYLRAYAEGAAGYGERKGYRPVPLGAVPVKFIPDKREMRAEV